MALTRLTPLPLASLCATGRSVAATVPLGRRLVPWRPHQESLGLSWSQRVTLRGTRRLASSSVAGEQTTTPSQDDAPGREGVSGKSLLISDSCVKQLHHVTAGDDSTMLRVTVEGGGCSGFQYKFNLDSSVNADDKIFERDRAKVVIDELSLGFLEGSTVDFHQELIRSSFRITSNPKAELGCSCGVSFAVKDL